ncbi:MAG: hypothetical protein KAW95_01490 [Dehalococcoidia bacterium]|nr:hypothetical protein [Dehalococcoidia bacterium]
MERCIISLANICREDGREFLRIAGEIKIQTRLEAFDFDELPEVLVGVAHGRVDGNAVIRVAG